MGDCPHTAPVVSERSKPAAWDARAADLPSDLTDARLAELLDGTEIEVLQRLAEGDPLGLRDVAMSRLREEGYLLNPDRVLARLTASVVRDAHKLTDVRKLRKWMYRATPKLMRDLMREDHEASRDGITEGQRVDENHGWLATMLRIEPELARSVAVAFNHLPKTLRTAFFEVVLLRTPTHSYAESTGVSVGEVEERVRLATLAISRATAPGAEGTQGEENP